MNVWRMKLKTRSKTWGNDREERMAWVRLQIRNEQKRLEALVYLGEKWVLYNKRERIAA